MNAQEKDKARAQMADQLSRMTPVSLMEIAIAIANTTTPLGMMFDLTYQQIEALTEANQVLQDGNSALRTRADLAAMKAQEYFVRLRDAGLLNKGETF